MSSHRPIVVLLLAAGVLSCAGGDTVATTRGAVATVSITPSAPQIEKGATLQLTADARDASGKSVSGVAIFWSSDAPAILTVSQIGLVTGITAGRARVAASVEGKSAVATVDVITRVPASVRITPSTRTLTAGDSASFDAMVLDALGGELPNEPILWSTNNPPVAVVGSNGLVTAIGPGTARISAISGALAATAVVTVTPRPVANVAVAPVQDTIAIGQTAQLAATATDAAGVKLNGRPVTWTSSAPAIATVAASGLVTAVAPGQATVTATIEGKTGSALVTVIPVPVDAVVLSPSQLSVVVGTTATITGKVTDAAGNPLANRPITFASNAPTIATVSATGVVTGIAPGSATISGTSGGKSGSAAVTVTPVPVASVAVSPSTGTLNVGQTTALVATPKDAAGNVLTGRTVTWSSGAPSIASVSATGTVTALAPGSASILATIDGVTGSATIAVQDLVVNTVSISPTAASLLPRQTTTLTATARTALGNVVTGRPVTWASSAATVATVSTTGVVTAVATGAATITATIDGIAGTASIAVNAPPVASVSVTPTTATVITGQTRQLAAVPLDASNTPIAGKTATWSTSAPTIATVSSTGLVTAVAPGAATITATIDGIPGNAAITVTLPPVASVSVSPNAATVIITQSKQLTAQALDAGGAAIPGKTATWSTSAPSVATVSSSGLVTAVATGSATITATIDNVKGNAAVTVTLPPVASVRVQPTIVGLITAQTQQIVATPLDSAGNPIAGKTVTWSTNAPSIASVSTSGLVTAVSPGSATITATIDTKTGTTQVTVSPPPVVAVSVAPTSATVITNQTLALVATAKAADSSVLTGRPTTWASNTPTVATVSQTGVVTGVTPGSATISVTIGGITANAAITVTLPPVVSVDVAPPTLSLATGHSQALTATPLDGNGQPIVGYTVSWSTSNFLVAVVSSTGTVTALLPGSATITATAGGKSGTATVGVSLAVAASVSVAPPSATIQPTGHVQLAATAREADGTIINGRQPTWTTSDPNIATVSASGDVVGVSNGTVTITASMDGASGASTITVQSAAVANVVVTPPTATLTAGQTVQLSAVAQDVNGVTIPGLVAGWATSDAAIATVDAAGLVTAGTTPGTVTITATMGGKTGTMTITVQ